MTTCRGCGSTVADSFRFCPWCAAPQRRKLVEFFRAHPHDADKALRVSRYLTEDPHVRFSVWNQDGIATAAISLDEEEAQRLASFLERPVPRSLRDRIASFVAR
jgi:DNA mismatch repair ATPase MutL